MAGGMARIIFLRHGDSLRKRPVRRVFTRPRGNEVIGGAFETKEAENGRQGCQPDSALTETRRVQPGFVEFEPHRQEVCDGLVKARDEESAYGRIGHTLILGVGNRPRHRDRESTLVTFSAAILASVRALQAWRIAAFVVLHLESNRKSRNRGASTDEHRPTHYSHL